jgi:bacterioferritin-associated ferredoxin
MSNQKKMTVEEIKARIKPVCICKGIKQHVICSAIKSGAKTVEEVNRACGSGSGGCKGRRCRPVIEKLISRGGELLVRPHEKPETDELEDVFE